MTNPENPIAKKVIPDVGPGAEELMHVHPSPEEPSEGVEAHPQFESLDGPTEASDNHDELTTPPERELGGRF